MRLNLDKIANESIGWIFHGTIKSRSKSYSRCRELIYKNYLGGQEKNDSK